MLASIDEAANIQFFDPVTGKNLQSKKLRALVDDESRPEDRLHVSLMFLLNEHLVIACGPWKVYIWDRTSDKLDGRLLSEFSRCGLKACSSSGSMVLNCSDGDGHSSHLVHYDHVNKSLSNLGIRQLSRRDNAVTYVTGTLIALTMPDETILFYDLIAGSSFRYRGHPEGEVAITSLVASPGGENVAVGYGDGLVHLWRVERRQQDLIGVCSSRTAVICIVFSPDGKTLATICADSRQVQIWSIQGEAYPTDPLTVHKEMVLSPRCDELACFTRNSSEHCVVVRDIARDFSFETKGSEGVTRVAFSLDGYQLAAALMGGLIEVYNKGNQWSYNTEKTYQLEEAKRVQLLVFSPDGKQLAASCNFNELRV